MWKKEGIAVLTRARHLFYAALECVRRLESGKKLPAWGKLCILDASIVRLGPLWGKWAYVSRDKNAVKLHTRLVLNAPGSACPDRVIPSTGNVDDREVVLELVEEADATYVMDRGYVDYTKMDAWAESHIAFVIRINAGHHATIVKEHPLPEGGTILLDAQVVLGRKPMKHAVRLIEFTDDKGRKYRIATTRWDLPPEDIAEIYRARWQVELFFKWVKQHLRLTHLASQDPQGIWNQIFLAMTAYALTLCVTKRLKSRHTAWDVLKLLRIYAHRSWTAFLKEVNRRRRVSKGRQKTEKERAPVKAHDGGGVAVVKPVGEKRRKTARWE